MFVFSRSFMIDVSVRMTWCSAKKWESSTIGWHRLTKNKRPQGLSQRILIRSLKALVGDHCDQYGDAEHSEAPATWFWSCHNNTLPCTKWWSSLISQVMMNQQTVLDALMPSMGNFSCQFPMHNRIKGASNCIVPSLPSLLLSTSVPVLPNVDNVIQCFYFLWRGGV